MFDYPYIRSCYGLLPVRTLLSAMLLIVCLVGKSQPDDLQIARNFAEGFEPCKDGVARLSNVSASVVSTFSRLMHSDPVVCDELLTLIFLKIHRSHLDCCNQSYELRVVPSSPTGIDQASDPLLYQFNCLSSLFKDGKPIEFFPSSMVTSWVKKNLHLKKFEPIRVEMLRIDRLNKRISEGQPWKG